jgi:hypothetical protein
VVVVLDFAIGADPAIMIAPEAKSTDEENTIRFLRKIMTIPHLSD